MVIEAKGIKGSSRGLQYQQSDKEVGQSQEIMRNGIIGDTPQEQNREMRAIENQYQKSNFQNYRLEMVISPTKEESKNFKTEDWENVAKKALEKSGIDHKNHAYIGHLHTSTGTPHMHLKVSRINFKGEMAISTENIGRKMGAASNEIAKERGWKTAKETGEHNRQEVSRNIREVLQDAKIQNIDEFSKAMEKRGYITKIAQSEAKGVYGMRIIPKGSAVENPSPQLAKSGQGYKLSEINKSENSKAKFKITDIKMDLQRNQDRYFANLPREKTPFEQAEEKRNQNQQDKINSIDTNQLRKETLENIDKAIQKIEPYREHNPQAYNGIKAMEKAIKSDNNFSADKLNQANQVAKNQISNIENQEKAQEQKPENINSFDQARQKREAKQEQEQNQEKKRGFRR